MSIPLLSSAPSHLQPWLSEQGSLTQCLKQVYSHFNVHVVCESYQRPTSQELALLACEGPYWVREVWLCDAQQALVFARSVVAQSYLQGELEPIAHLASRPLGELLFSHPNCQRQSVELCFDCAPNTLGDARLAAPLWGRRSRFVLGEAPLLVTEYFLPSLVAHPKGLYV